MLTLRMKEMKNKGFTLVELIVVIVVLGILASIAVPSLVGYIDKSRSTGVIAECRQMVIAAQALATEQHAKGSPVQNGQMTSAGNEEFFETVALLGEKPESAEILMMNFQESILSQLRYTNNDITVLYDNGEYIIEGAAGDTGGDESPQEYDSLSIVDPLTGEKYTFVPIEVVPGMKAIDIKGNTVWYEGDENYEAGYYYISERCYIDKSIVVDDVRSLIYDVIKPMNPGRGRYFRLIDTQTPVQTYNWSDWSGITNKNQLNAELGAFLQFGQFYMIDLTPTDGIDNPVLAMYRGPQESYTYHAYLGDVATHPDFWTEASKM